MKYLDKIIIFLLVVGMASCDFEDYNVDPTSLSQEQVTVDLILPKAQVQTAYNMGATAGRYAGIWMQYFEGVEAQQNALTNYVLQDTDVNNTWSAQLYTGALRDCITILNVAESEDNPSNHYAGIAKILLAQNLGFATQLWGDLPYSEAFAGVENLNPAFDTQESIYETIQTLLGEAITALEADLIGRPVGSDDLIYGGDLDAWIATARSLSARYYIQTLNRNGTAAQSALDQINAGAIGSVSEQPDFPFAATNNGANPIFLFELDRPATLQADPTFVNTVMNADPRQDIYFVAGDRNQFAADGLYWGVQDSPMPLISYSEVKFIEAEAILRTGGTVAAASAALEEAILANMEQVGVGTAVATAYATLNSDLSSEANAFDKIITEKYKALYIQGMVEIWSDYRRTGFPSLVQPEPGAAISVVPRRLLYPQNEKQANAASVQEAVSRQGGDAIDTDLWVFAN
jgi:hypothetical protein